MTLHFPDELQPFKRTLNSCSVQLYEAILRKYAEGSDKEEVLTMLRASEEYLSTTPDPLEQQVKELKRMTDHLFGNLL